jgi:hypothetical protein
MIIKGGNIQGIQEMRPIQKIQPIPRSKLDTSVEILSTLKGILLKKSELSTNILETKIKAFNKFLELIKSNEELRDNPKIKELLSNIEYIIGNNKSRLFTVTNNSSQKNNIKKEANRIFKLFMEKTELAIGFLDKLGPEHRLTKKRNSILLNNAISNNRELGKNIIALYEEYNAFYKEYQFYLGKTDETVENRYKFMNQLKKVEERMSQYRLKVDEAIRKYVNFVN